MKDTSLTYDFAPLAIFAVAAIIFLVGWFQTGQDFFLFAALLLGLATAYTVYRIRNLYMRN